MKTDSRLRHGVSAALSVTCLVLAGYSAAQITAPSGAQSQDKRSSSEGASGPVQEGYAPQSKDAKSSAPPPHQGDQGDKQKNEGATGFDKGLYGTGGGRQ